MNKITIDYTLEGVTVEAPTFEPKEGNFEGAVTVTLACATEGASIYYTLDGSTPDETSQTINPFTINATTTVKAIAIKGADKSAVAEKTYTELVVNQYEVKEAIDTLKGKGPADFTELVLNLACRMVMLSGIETDENKAMGLLKENIANGKALDKLAEFVSAQGGDSRAVYDTDLLPKANNVYELKADKDGYITHINCEEVGIASLVLGGGRETLDSVIDLSVGIVLNKKCGDKVSAGDVLAYVHYNDDKKKEDSVKKLLLLYLMDIYYSREQ